MKWWGGADFKKPLHFPQSGVNLLPSGLLDEENARRYNRCYSIAVVLYWKLWALPPPWRHSAFVIWISCQFRFIYYAPCVGSDAINNFKVTADISLFGKRIVKRMHTAHVSSVAYFSCPALTRHIPVIMYWHQVLMHWNWLFSMLKLINCVPIVFVTSLLTSHMMPHWAASVRHFENKCWISICLPLVPNPSSWFISSWLLPVA